MPFSNWGVRSSGFDGLLLKVAGCPLTAAQFGDLCFGYRT